mmetsp:Transcript_40113/g.92162  ORF Transcript_40113/g.92162 Transcript_40113/m.92162 type:complete len:267 (+) Transcript_40113:83-883(+)
MASKETAANQVMDLRDRLLREAEAWRSDHMQQAKAEQHSGFNVSEAVAQLMQPALSSKRKDTVAIQTDFVIIEDTLARVGTQVMDRAMGFDSMSPFGGRSPMRTLPLQSHPTWSSADDAAQEEALQAVRRLGRHRSGASDSEARLLQLEAELLAEQQGREDTKLHLSQENNRLAAAQEQVLCLERELDEKDMELQDTERELEFKDRDLQQAMMQLQMMQEEANMHASHHMSEDDVRYKAMRVRLLERERQLELKDQHIARLHAVLR